MRAARDGLAAVISVPMAFATSPSITLASSFVIRAPVQDISAPIRSTQIAPSALRAISMTESSSRNGTMAFICRRSAESCRATDSLREAITRSWWSPAVDGQVVALVGTEQIDKEPLPVADLLPDEVEHLGVPALGRLLGGLASLGRELGRVGEPHLSPGRAELGETVDFALQTSDASSD